MLGNKYPITFAAPESIKKDEYLRICEGFTNINFELFPDLYFKDLDNYSNLMTSVSFYERFYKYKFILIYQLDVFVFRDELAYRYR
jgi:hypothetical protein